MTELSVEIETITPQLAEAFLETMGVNRPLSSSNLAKITADMRAGRWHADGGPIRFDRAGRLVDGQHRLWALIETGKTFDFVVVRDVDSAAMATMDTGKARSASDIIGIHDPSAKQLTALAAVTSIAWRWTQGVRGIRLRSSPIANDDLLRFYDEHKESLAAATRAGRRISWAVRGAPAQGFSLCVWLFDRIDAGDAEYFGNRLIDGVGLSDGDPIYALRELMLREAAGRRVGSSMRADLCVALVIKAWNAYRAGASIRVLSFKAGGAAPERFPEPV